MLLSQLLFLILALSFHSPTARASPAPNTKRVTILYDAFGRRRGLTRDWGFATLVEYGGKRILFDTGNNADIFARNVRALGVDSSGSTSSSSLIATATTWRGSIICSGSIRT